MPAAAGSRARSATARTTRRCHAGSAMSSGSRSSAPSSPGDEPARLVIDGFSCETQLAHLSDLRSTTLVGLSGRRSTPDQSGPGDGTRLSSVRARPGWRPRRRAGSPWPRTSRPIVGVWSAVRNWVSWSMIGLLARLHRRGERADGQRGAVERVRAVVRVAAGVAADGAVRREGGGERRAGDRRDDGLRAVVVAGHVPLADERVGGRRLVGEQLLAARLVDREACPRWRCTSRPRRGSRGTPARTRSRRRRRPSPWSPLCRT